MPSLLKWKHKLEQHFNEFVHKRDTLVLVEIFIYLTLFQLFESFETLMDLVEASGVIIPESVAELR